MRVGATAIGNTGMAATEARLLSAMATADSMLELPPLRLLLLPRSTIRCPIIRLSTTHRSIIMGIRPLTDVGDRGVKRKTPRTECGGVLVVAGQFISPFRSGASIHRYS